MMVLDASAAIELLIWSQLGAKVRQRIQSIADAVHVPHLIDLEITQVLRKLVLAGFLTDSRGSEALSDLRDLPLIRYPHQQLIQRIWELRHNLSAYDAAYVALAEALDVPLLTCDSKIAAAPGHRARVELAQ
jgi:predicted nucleic acid-binding protein